MLDQDVRLPGPAGEPAGRPRRLPQRRGAAEVWVDGDVQDAWFVRNASDFPLDRDRRDPNLRQSVLFGTSKPVAKRGSFLVDVVAPTEGPLVLDAGESYTLYLPSLGVPGEGSPAEAAEDLADLRRRPMRLFVAAAGRDQVPGALKAQLESTAWWFPVGYTLTAQAGGQRFEDRLVQATPPPVGPITWRWSGTNRLLIQALAERPSWTARAQRLQFLAGVLVGLGGGFLIWSLELWYGVLVRPGRGAA